MFRKKILKFSKSILKLVLPIFFKILIKLKLNRRTINFLQMKKVILVIILMILQE